MHLHTRSGHHDNTHSTHKVPSACSRFKDLLAYCRVNCTERVVQQVDICLVVDSSGQVDSSLLPTTQGRTPLTHHSQVSIEQLSQILKI